MEGARRTVWLDPDDVLLVVEVVSAGSEDLDRIIKPREYAEAGVPWFWRVERDGEPTVLVHRLNGDTYDLVDIVPLDELVLRPAPAWTSDPRPPAPGRAPRRAPATRAAHLRRQEIAVAGW
ncbi:Uma2 family endonuclease [Luedemannella flava]